MTLSIRNILRSVSVLALTAAFVPGCDDGEYDALGLSSEEIDAMSEAELDELAALEDELEHSVNIRPLSDHPAEPTHTGEGTAIEGSDTLWNPTHTHAAAVETIDVLWHPTHTHAGISDALRPTHGVVGNQEVGLPDPGCQLDPEQPVLTAKR